MKPKGYLPHSVVKSVIFWLLTLCIVFATVAGILGAWGLLDERAVDRCLWSAFILAAGSLVFLGINCAFGGLGSFLVTPSEDGPANDPSFGDRLKKAKVSSAEEMHS